MLCTDFGKSLDSFTPSLPLARPPRLQQGVLSLVCSPRVILYLSTIMGGHTLEEKGIVMQECVA